MEVFPQWPTQKLPNTVQHKRAEFFQHLVFTWPEPYWLGSLDFYLRLSKVLLLSGPAKWSLALPPPAGILASGHSRPLTAAHDRSRPLTATHGYSRPFINLRGSQCAPGAVAGWVAKWVCKVGLQLGWLPRPPEFVEGGADPGPTLQTRFGQIWEF